MGRGLQPLAGVIFDMDGVLCLSEPFIAAAACRMFQETHGVAATPEDFRPFVGTGEDRFLGGVAEKYGVRLVMPRDKARTYAIYLEIIQGQLQPLPGAIDFIKGCRRRGLKVAVATSADRIKLEGNLREIGLPLDMFDATVNGDDIARKKPYPDIFLLAAERLGLPAGDCLVVEDAPSGVAAAKAAGSLCLALTTTFTRPQLQQAGADFYGADLAHVPRAVMARLPKAGAESGVTTSRSAALNRAAATPHPPPVESKGSGTGAGLSRDGERRQRERHAPVSPRRGRGRPRVVSGPGEGAASPTATGATPGLKILFVASECTPYAKSGGLGDVVAGLAKELRRQGHDARVLMPLYGFIDSAQRGITFESSCCVHMNPATEVWAGLYSARLDDEVPVWFLDHAQSYGGNELYAGAADVHRFALLAKAALQVCKDQAFIPDVMHLHDWMTTLAAVYLKTWDRVLSPLSATASVLTIHNIGYQGKFPAAVLPAIGVGQEHFLPDRLEDYGGINLLKAGIHFADALTTVSPTHAREIREPVGGHGLAPYLNDRAADLVGILNGCDYEHWDPATDKHLPARYSATDLAGKAVCKAALQRQLGLEVRPDLPLFGVVSRFASQKGFDLLLAALPRVLEGMAMQFVVLGSGDAQTEYSFRWLPAAWPGRVGAHIGFSVELSHLIEAGSDFFLMPSYYEPCGLNQMYSLKYGTLPIVRATGGLEDSVENYDERRGTGTGFKFLQPTAQALHDTIGWAVSTWFDRPHHLAQLRQQAMAQDFSWAKSVARYVEVYRQAMTKRRGG